VQSYLEHHGAKLSRRFDAGSYVRLTEAMNSHDIGRDRGGVEAALRRITADLTAVVVDSDRLFTLAEGERIAASPASRGLVSVNSPFGHDAFLIETDQVFAAIGDALADRPVGTSTPPRVAAIQRDRVEAQPERATGPWPGRRAEARPPVPFSSPGLPPVLNGTGLW
jgi:homoserine O-acetyltransferase